MRVLIASDTYYPDLNGCSLFTQRLAKALIKRGHTVVVIAPSTKILNTIYRHDGINIVGVRSVSPIIYKNIRVTPPIGIKSIIRQTLETFQPDIVQIQSPFIVSRTTASLAKAAGYPLVGTVLFIPENLLHNLARYFPLMKVKQVENAMNGILWKNLCTIFNTFDKVTAPTQTAVDLAHSFGVRKTILPISCGINNKLFKPGKKKNTLLRKYKIPDEPIILYLGRLDQEKHVDTIITAFSHVVKRRKAHLVVAGIGLKENDLKAQVADLHLQKKVTFTGKVPVKDLPDLYRLATIFVNASTAELQSIVTMEAMATGLPIIAANALALPELVRNGENGFLFQPKNDQQLAISMERLLTDDTLRKKMGEESLHIIKRHTFEQTVDAYEDMFTEVLAKKMPVKKMLQL